jgi:hypothetical protein
MHCSVEVKKTTPDFVTIHNVLFFVRESEKHFTFMMDAFLSINRNVHGFGNRTAMSCKGGHNKITAVTTQRKLSRSFIFWDKTP